ncbi:hypothetical protein GQ53DRAFT_544708 [Thozetella sp. PMI_491]|nr:hypothetical protein GQ53DRAFT_544708 [Thozetella sp. PMI_491]
MHRRGNLPRLRWGYQYRGQNVTYHSRTTPHCLAVDRLVWQPPSGSRRRVFPPTLLFRGRPSLRAWLAPGLTATREVRRGGGTPPRPWIQGCGGHVQLDNIGATDGRRCLDADGTAPARHL